MLQDLDATLKSLLLKAQQEVPGLLAIDDVRFATPDRAFKPDGLLLSLFLLDVSENRELRDVRPVRERVGEVYVSRKPPLRVDCTYLVTAWSNETGETKATHEHRLLGETMLWLSRHSTVPDDLLVGSMRAPAYPASLSLARAREERELGQLWTALGIPPRSAFFLTATISMDVPTTLDQFRQVAEVVLRVGVGQEETGPSGPTYVAETRQIGGIVLGAIQGQETQARPIAGARVRIEPGGLTAETDVDGRYLVGPLTPGVYSVVVQAAGFPETNRQIQVPLADPSGNYDVTLTQP